MYNFFLRVFCQYCAHLICSIYNYYVNNPIKIDNSNMKPSYGLTKVTDKVNSATVIMLVMRGHHYKTIN